MRSQTRKRVQQGGRNTDEQTACYRFGYVEITQDLYPAVQPATESENENGKVKRGETFKLHLTFLSL